MEDINKKICALDHIIDVKLVTNSSVVKFNNPNQLQSTYFGMTSAPTRERSSNVSDVKLGLDFLARVIGQMCISKGFDTNFEQEFNKISSVLESDEFALSELEKDLASLTKNMYGVASDFEYDYPTYNRDRLEDVYELKRRQVAILLHTLIELYNFIENNGLDIDYTYRYSSKHDYYDNSYEDIYIVEDCFNACRESLRKCVKLFSSNTKNNEVGETTGSFRV